MELWIRSQKKTSLVKAESVTYSNNYFVIVNGKSVGDYESEQRCIEILDEIQKILSDTILLVNNSGKETLDNLYGNGIALMNGNEKIEQLSTYVYQMPEK